MSKFLKYRRDIDGLRAAAVLLVMLYHFEFSGLPGGFVGVDVFFVISGFLITAIIDRATRQGSFSARSFYLRRVRRLAPALLVTLAITFAFGAVVFSTEELSDLANSSAFAVLSASNVYFWLTSGYFDLDSSLKPALHTWSLGVEEQFYFVWPFLIWGLAKLGRKSVTLISVILLGGLSLWAAEVMLSFDPQASFYLTPFRIYEFALGAILVWLPDLHHRSNWLKEFVFLTGLALLLYAGLFFNAETPFPGLSALVPSIGATLIILAGNPRFSGRLLSNGAMVWIGLISYSAYLIHWPVFVFTIFTLEGDLTLPFQAGLIAATLILASLSYVLVEQPFRNPEHRLVGAFRGLTAIATSVVAFLLIMTSVWITDGWSWRVPDEVRVLAGDISEDRSYTYREHRCFLQPNDPASNLTQQHYEECLQPLEGKQNYLILGSSLAAHLYIGLKLNFPDANFLQATSSLCMPIRGFTKNNRPNCGPMLKFIYDDYLARSPDIDALFLVPQRGYARNYDALDTTLTYLESQDIKTVLVPPMPAFTESVPALLEKYGKKEGFEAYLRSQLTDEDDDRAAIQQVADEHDTPVIWIEDLLCNKSECAAFSEGKLLYRDQIHLSTVGSVFVANEIRETYPRLFD